MRLFDDNLGSVRYSQRLHEKLINQVYQRDWRDMKLIMLGWVRCFNERLDSCMRLDVQ